MGLSTWRVETVNIIECEAFPDPIYPLTFQCKTKALKKINVIDGVILTSLNLLAWKARAQYEK